MASLSELAASIRSKNAGPFWVTVDVFFNDQESFDTTSGALQTRRVAEVLQVDQDSIKRFDLKDISVIKFSFPRPVVQGDRFDRDMHGAQFAWLLADIELNLSAE